MKRLLHLPRTTAGFGDRRPNLCIASPFCLTAALLLNSGCSKTHTPGPGNLAPVTQVSVAVAVRSNVPIELKAIGHAAPFSSIAIRSQVGGFLDGIHFQEGAMVKAGDLLFTIDKRPFENALARARSDLEKDLGLQKQACSEEQENAALLHSNVISRDNYNESAAYADSLKAAVAADKALVDSAELELSYCQIRSPIDGRAGFVQINQGNIIQPGEMVLVTVNQTQPILIDFAVTERELPAIRDSVANGSLEVQAAVDQRQTWRIGEVTSMDNAVDPNTQTVLVRARFPNQDEALWPGQTVNVLLSLHTLKDAAIIPCAAVQKGQNGDSVFVLNPDATVESRPVEISIQLGDQVAVCKGLEAGERVVTRCQQRLEPGIKVRVL